MTIKNVKSKPYPSKNKKTRPVHRGAVSTEMAKSNFERYAQKAKNAVTSGDRILGENYYQFAEHYMRICNSFEVKTSNQD